MNVVWHDAIPVVAAGTSVQVPEPPSEPLVGADLNETVPVGVLSPLDAVSFTLAVHVAAAAAVTDGGEHTTPVDVGSTELMAARCRCSRRGLRRRRRRP